MALKHRATHPLQGRPALRRILLRMIELGASIVFFSAVLYHVYTFNLKPLAAFLIPVLVVFFAFSSLLFMRGRSLAPGSAQNRSLFAAERAMQASAWYLLGIILGVTCYGLLLRFGVAFNPEEPTPAGFWLLAFVAPYALMQTGFLLFMRAAWLITPQFFRRVSPFEIRRRIEQPVQSAGPQLAACSAMTAKA